MKIINDLNLKKQASELGVSVWQTPSFLFIMMGAITVVAMTAVFYISRYYDSPEILVIAESVVVITIFTIGNSIIASVEQMARLNKMKSEFVSVASHQLRTPLSAIRWETELLLSKFNIGLNDKQRETIESISMLSQRMTRLVSDLLDVARIDQGRLMLRRECINLTEITKATIEEILPLARAKNTRLVFAEAKAPVFVTGDADKLRLAIENLISNAVKYTLGKGLVSVNIQQKHGFVVLNVKDDGVGIPEEQQEQVFNKFFRSDNVVKYQTEGTGLGLYIAKNIVEQLGGKIWFNSKEGIGSIFSFSLPACSVSAELVEKVKREA